MASPAVSICLTTYNRGPVLAATVDSILAQSFEDFELIISDDRSTDDTAEICRAYAERDSRVRYFCNAENLKMPGNLNAAIERGTGHYVANLHDGDTYRPDLIERWKAALDRHPRAAFVFNGYDRIDYDGVHHAETFPSRDGLVAGSDVALYFFRTWGCCVWGTVMARRSAYEKALPFRSRFGFVSDVDMWMRLGAEHDIAYVAEPLITLTPREREHPYAYVHWRIDFWLAGIYTDALARYAKLVPTEVARVRQEYPRALRKRLLRRAALCIKHRRFGMLREGLAMARDADDPLLRTLGRSLGRASDAPEWYTPEWWELARLSDPA